MRRSEQGELQIITRAGIPVGGVILMADVERFYPERLGAEVKRKRAWQQLMEVLDQTQQGGEKFSEEEVEADIQRAVDAVRHLKRKR